MQAEESSDSHYQRAQTHEWSCKNYNADMGKYHITIIPPGPDASVAAALRLRVGASAFPPSSPNPLPTFLNPLSESPPARAQEAVKE